ncbi:MAG: gliding motility protein GldN [Bacteroidetes bacterium]|jgi:gliding motility associated protien GldN|nr:gliding motility protein GldN [Bacteroidota bacterium]MBK9799831.1 gliding motility protein GldN [Bacteroidota bacterium]HRH01992.1 gliding motility protein GldN [Bacteroidia bacterium]HRH07704.1 gliding motility protein GldN [Bacteroidia bacterium]HRH62592.1 gliding motility protein GldN [Bacteroidia bacterium]
MKKLKLIAVFFFVVMFSLVSKAQTNVLDGVYVKEHTPERKVIPYTYLREADVQWAKRIWRTIDLREKKNHPLYFPTEPINNRKSLSQVILDAILNDGTITAYDGFDDEFKKPLSKAEISAKIAPKSDTTYVDDPENPGNLIPKVVLTEFKPSSIKKYRIKEDWFFDKQRSVMDVRIIGLCALEDKLNDDGSFKALSPMFWIYYPEARYVFANAEVFNRNNDSERRTLEDIIWKRDFSSFVYKEANVYDRDISEYKSGMDALLEAEKIKENIFNYEHDMWEY